MFQHFTWSLILWTASILAVALTWQFGFLGILLAAVLSLIIGVAVPNDLIFTKPPDSVHRKSGFRFYKNEAIFGFIIIVFFVTSMAIGIFVWTDSPSNLAQRVNDWSFSPSLFKKSARAVEVLSRPESYEFSGYEYRQEQMFKYYPRVSLWAILMRPMIYLTISFALVKFTFDRVRSERANTNFSSTKRLHFKDYLVVFCFGLGLAWISDSYTAVPYQFVFAPNLIEELVLVSMTIILCISVLAILGAFTSIVSKSISNQTVDSNTPRD